MKAAFKLEIVRHWTTTRGMTHNEVEAGGRIIQSFGVSLHEFDVT